MQDQYVVLEDPELPHTSTGYNVLVQQLELITLTSNFVKQQLLTEAKSGWTVFIEHARLSLPLDIDWIFESLCGQMSKWTLHAHVYVSECEVGTQLGPTQLVSQLVSAAGHSLYGML